MSGFFQFSLTPSQKFEMRNFHYSILLVAVLLVSACTTNRMSQDQIQAKIFSNNFTFVAKNFENRLSFSAPAGTGRIAQTNIPVNSDENIGIQVTHDKLIINLPSTDHENSISKFSLRVNSEDFTAARKALPDGSILVNYILEDNTNINLIKMEVDKEGKIDCSVEGPAQKPLLFTGYLKP